MRRPKHPTNFFGLATGVLTTIVLACCASESNGASSWEIATSGLGFGGVVAPNHVELRQVYATRNRRRTIFYAAPESRRNLILGTVTDMFIPGQNRPLLVHDYYPINGAPDGNLRDPHITRGLLTPGTGDGNFVQGDEFTTYTFETPVLNQPGGDFFFSFLTFGASTHEAKPDPYWLSGDGRNPVLMEPDLGPRLHTYQIENYISSLSVFTAPNGARTPADLLQVDFQYQLVDDLMSEREPLHYSLHLIDASDLGVPNGSTISSISIWADDAVGEAIVHPVFIAGLPVVVPEPNSSVLLTVSVLSVLSARRRRRSTTFA